MTKKEILKIRILIAQVIDIPPDDIEILEKMDDKIFFDVPYNTYNMVIEITDAFCEISKEEMNEVLNLIIDSIEDLRENVQDWEMGESGYN